MTKQKIIIANSVGRDYEGNHYIHFPSRWTAIVGKFKDFSFYPYELAYLSSLLKRETKHQIKMIDGNLLELNPKEYIKLIEREAPDWLIMETSTVLYPYDLEVAKAIKDKFGTKLVFCGQHPTAFPDEVLKDGIDYVCLGEFEYTVLDLINSKDPQDILGLYPNGYRPLLDVNTLPFPEDKDISRMDYYHIGGCDYKEIEFFASRGCPFSCVYCVCGNLYYPRPNWRSRNIGSIISEIKYLKNKYPEMEGIFFDEENHNVNKKFILELCQAIKDNGLNHLKYNAMCGYWTLDEEMLKAMKSAGYYKLRIGIESASHLVAREIRKVIDIDRLKIALRIAKRVGIKIYGTFTFGAPGSIKEEDMKTIHLIKELIAEDLLYDYQTSVCTPQPGTPFFKVAEEKNFLITKDWTKYDGNTAVVSYPNYSSHEIEAMVGLAFQIYVKKIVKNRGGYISIFLQQARKHGFFGVIRQSFQFLLGWFKLIIAR